MLRHLNYFSKLATTAAVSWLKINLLGLISLSFTFSFSLIFMLSDLSEAGHVDALAFLLYLMETKTIPFIILLLLLVSPIVLLVLSHQYIIAKITNRVVNDKAETYLYPILDKIILKFKTLQPELIKQNADAALVKVKLIHQIKNESENKWVKRILIYGLEKVQLDHNNFGKADANFGDIIKTKTLEALHNITEPGRKNIWLLLGSQWLCLLLIWILT